MTDVLKTGRLLAGRLRLPVKNQFCSSYISCLGLNRVVNGLNGSDTVKTVYFKN